MMDSFLFPGLKTRVLFGSGTLGQAAVELERLGHDRVLVLSTDHQAAQARDLAKLLGHQAVGVFSGAAMHTPVEITEQALAVFRESDATAVVSIGGGSTIGLGKAIAVRTGADQLVIPTTYAGSEMTDILGETEGHEKKTRRSEDIRPETVIYDVDLTMSLPLAMTVTSAMNALAHAMEAFYAPDRSPVIELMCRDALSAFHDGIPLLIADPHDQGARVRVLYAAWCCSTALGYVSMALHHKLAHVLGGSFNTPHAETHAILLPHTTAYNEVAVRELLSPIAKVFGGGSAAGGLWDFAKAVRAPLSLKEIGITETDLDRATEIALRNAYTNPRPLERDAIRGLLQSAWEGSRPNQ